MSLFRKSLFNSTIDLPAAKGSMSTSLAMKRKDKHHSPSAYRPTAFTNSLDCNISLKAKYAREYVCDRIDKKLGGKKKQTQNSGDFWLSNGDTQET